MSRNGATAPLPRSASTGEPVSDLLDVPLIVGSGGATMREPASGAAAVEGGMGEGPCLVGTEATRNASRQSTISAIARASKARADSSNPARTGPYSEARDGKVASCAAAASRPQSRIETRATSSGEGKLTSRIKAPARASTVAAPSVAFTILTHRVGESFISEQHSGRINLAPGRTRRMVFTRPRP